MRSKLLLLCLCVGSSAACADSMTLKNSVPHITMSGAASKEVVPDVAVLYLAVVNERPDSESATQATAKAAEDLVAAIKARGIESKDIEATFTLEALIDVKTDKSGKTIESKLRGYRAQEYINVTVRDTKTAGALAQAFITSGANELRSVSYFISKRKELNRELDAAAYRDALAQAKTYTDAAGLELGRVLQIGDDSQPASEDGAADLPSRRAPPVLGPTAVPLEPGTQTLSESITVTWEITDAAAK